MSNDNGTSSIAAQQQPNIGLQFDENDNPVYSTVLGTRRPHTPANIEQYQKNIASYNAALIVWKQHHTRSPDARSKLTYTAYQQHLQAAAASSSMSDVRAPDPQRTEVLIPTRCLICYEEDNLFALMCCGCKQHMCVPCFDKTPKACPSCRSESPTASMMYQVQRSTLIAAMPKEAAEGNLKLTIEHALVINTNYHRQLDQSIHLIASEVTEATFGGLNDRDSRVIGDKADLDERLTRTTSKLQGLLASYNGARNSALQSLRYMKRLADDVARAKVKKMTEENAVGLRNMRASGHSQPSPRARPY